MVSSEAMEVTSDSVPSPEISFVDGATIDMGDIKAGDMVTKTITIKNTGTLPLEILNVFTGCGCLDAKYTKDPVEAGKETKLEITFRSRGYSKGSFLKTVKVRANTSARIHRLFIKAHIVE